MSQSEALAYLVLGRSLTGASSDQAQVNAASAALSAGSGLLASQLGAKLGLDDAGVSQSRALGGSVIGVGKYISPKLYVGYGVSLVGAGSVITLKYLLRRGFDVEVESSTVENRGSINWRRRNRATPCVAAVIAGQRPAPCASPQPSAVAPSVPSGYGPGLFCTAGNADVCPQSPSHRPGPGPDPRRRCPRR